jgi:YHS domain-containing protein
VSVPRQQAPPATVPLHRDPVCGTYVSAEISFPLEQPGQILHFCSSECRAKYEQSSRRAASA